MIALRVGSDNECFIIEFELLVFRDFFVSFIWLCLDICLKFWQHFDVGVVSYRLSLFDWGGVVWIWVTRWSLLFELNEPWDTEDGDEMTCFCFIFGELLPLVFVNQDLMFKRFDILFSTPLLLFELPNVDIGDDWEFGKVWFKPLWIQIN